ncbi:MAG: tetratricopeptide repeat protein [bacterium]|jgi:tetratricopeptide (TPR) repeat protein
MVQKHNRLQHLVLTLLIIILLVSGCQNLPTMGSEPGNEETKDLSQWKKAFQQYLPQGGFLIQPSQDGINLTPPPLVQQADLDNDGVPELIAGYRVGEATVGVLVLKQENGHWSKLWEGRGEGPGLTLLHLADITGNGTPELLVGWGLGSDAGNQLNIVTLHNEVRTLTELPYHRLDIINFPGDYGCDGKTKLAVWNQVNNNAYEVEVYRYALGKLFPAIDIYRDYFPKVVEYYEQQVLAMPDHSSLWYYLADAQLKSGRLEDALKSIARAEDFEPSPYPPGALAVLKGDVLLAQGKLQDALKAYLELASFDPEGIDRRHKARALYGLGRIKEKLSGITANAAKADYKRAVDTDPSWLLPTLALERAGAVSLTHTLADYLSHLAPDKRTEGIAELGQFAKEHNINIQYVSQTLGKERLRVIAADYAPADQPSNPVAHALFWWEGLSKGPVTCQVFYSAEAVYHGLDQSCTLKDISLSLDSDNNVQATLIYTQNKNKSPQDIRYQLSLENDGHWQVISRDLPQQ